MTALEVVFISSFFLGLAYAVISTILGGVFGGHEGGGDTGGEFDVQHDIAGHIDTHAEADSGTIHFSPLSPVVIAMFITSFGAMGMICLKVFALSATPSLAISVLTGIVVAGITFAFFLFLFKATQGSSESHLSAMVGEEAEVITTIPAEGLGEVAYISKGTRYTAPARSISKVEIKTHSVVIVEKISSSILLVKSSDRLAVPL